MLFKHPEILYALFLLLIPIIIHLFQLRRFKKVVFTNVKFLQQIKLQTRKSSQLKKWLTLLIRLLIIACLVFAFAQPYSSKKNKTNKTLEYVIYLDNSFSMEAKGQSGELFKRAIQDLITVVPENEKITLFTNDKVYKNTKINDIKNELLNLDYSPIQLKFKAILLKGKQYFSSSKNSIKEFLVISDFQKELGDISPQKDSTYSLNLITLSPVKTNNISIDSAFVYNENQLKVNLSSTDELLDNVVLSLYHDSKLIAKASANSIQDELIFTLPEKPFTGKLSIIDNDLSYDNSLFINSDDIPKVKVLAINQADDTFLKRLYADDEFVYSSISLNAINYSSIANQNLIILNELNTIGTSLVVALKNFVSNGGYLIVIPSQEINNSSYNNLLNNYSLNYKEQINSTRFITTINFSHPLFKGVFDKEINNFQYPKVESYHLLETNQSNILSFDNLKPFLTSSSSVYVFASGLQKSSSNFSNSPLIVPVFYNIGKQSLKSQQLYYQILKENQIDIEKSLSNDMVLEMENSGDKFIPLQQIFSAKTKITTLEKPDKAGIYSINLNDEFIKHVSYNYPRNESKLLYYNNDELSSFKTNTNILQYFKAIKNDTNINAQWKWFIILALIFLILEMLILNYFK